MTEEEAADIRVRHRPAPDDCRCGNWVCSGCGEMWPCHFERLVRDSGVRPHGIYDYEAGRV